MGRLVAVLRGAGGEQTCSDRVTEDCQLPLVIEHQLTFLLTLDRTGDSQTDGVSSKHDRETFLNSYRSLSEAEVRSSLAARTEDVTRTVTALVTCLGCRKAVESLHHDVARHGQQLGRLTISKDGAVSISREQTGETCLANILSSDLLRAGQEVGTGRRGKARGRCPLHSLETKKPTSSINWEQTWDCMEQKCREEVVLLPFLSVRHTLDGYLKRHKFCSDCTFMVNRAYFFLMSEGELRVKPSYSCQRSKLMDSHAGLYSAISACPLVKYVYVQCSRELLTDLYNLIEPELSGLTDTRHAKTMELAQKEVLTVIGLTLFERFRKIQQKLEEAEQNYNLLNLTLLQTLRTSFDLAADTKRGDRHFELLCQELEMEERKEERKKEKKKEKKRNQRAKKKESSPENETLAEVRNTGHDTAAKETEEKKSSIENLNVFKMVESAPPSQDDTNLIETGEEDFENVRDTEEPDGVSCSVFCSADHSETAGKEKCGNVRQVGQGWLTSEALSPHLSPPTLSSKRKSSRQKQTSSAGDSGFSSAESKDIQRKQSLSGDDSGPADDSEGQKTRESTSSTCSVFCKWGASKVEPDPGETFPHTVCLAEWLTAQYVQNPDIDLFSAFFLGVNF